MCPRGSGKTSWRTADSIDGPDAGGGEFEQVAIGIAEVEAGSTEFPCAFLFHVNPFSRQPRLPIRQFCGGDREGKTEFTVAVMGRSYFRVRLLF